MSRHGSRLEGGVCQVGSQAGIRVGRYGWCYFFTSLLSHMVDLLELGIALAKAENVEEFIKEIVRMDWEEYFTSSLKILFKFYNFANIGKARVELISNFLEGELELADILLRGCHMVPVKDLFEFSMMLVDEGKNHKFHTFCRLFSRAGEEATEDLYRDCSHAFPRWRLEMFMDYLKIE